MELDKQIRSTSEPKKQFENPIPRADLQCVIDVRRKSVTFDTNDLFFPDVQLFFGFRDNGELGVEFDRMTYGWDLSILGEAGLSSFVTSKEYPGYISTDALYSQHETLRLQKEQSYGLNVWCKNSGERFSAQCTFRVAHWQEAYPKDIAVPKPGDEGYARINVADPWWV